MSKLCYYIKHARSTTFCLLNQHEWYQNNYFPFITFAPNLWVDPVSLARYWTYVDNPRVSLAPQGDNELKKEKNIVMRSIRIRYLLRFFDCLAHPNLSATCATDQKWPICHLRISYQILAGSLRSLKKSEFLKLIISFFHYI